MLLKKTKHILIVVIFMFVAIIVLMDSFPTDYSKYDPNEWLEEIESDWNIRFDKAEKTIYGVNSQSGFHGDGASYTVVQFSNGNKVKRMFDWKKIDKDEIDSIKYWLDDLDADEKNRPNFKRSMCYTKYKDSDEDDDKIYIIRDQSRPDNVYILETYT